LICSISAMYFLMRSFEVLKESRTDSKIFLIVIGLVIIHMFTIDMEFDNVTFYVRGHDHFIWSFAWAFLYFYRNFVIFVHSQHSSQPSTRRFLLLYTFCTLNFSWLISIAYAYSAALYQQEMFTAACNAVGIGDLFASFNIIKDLPSVW